MKKKIFFVFVIFFCRAFLSFAQSNVDKAGQRITWILQNEHNLDTSIFNKLCGRGCVFVKFKFNKTGKIASFSYSKDSLGLAKSLYVSIIALQNDKELQRILKKTDIDFVLPVLYDFDLGCLYPSIDMTIATKEDKYKYMLSFYKTQINNDFYLRDLFDMLNFDGRKVYAIKCILLTPVTFGSMKPTAY